MSGVDWAVLAVVLLAVGAAVFFAVRHKKRGGCCGDCSACAQCGFCKETQKTADK